MKFSVVADTLSYMENTTKRLELTQHLVDLFKITPPEIISKVIYLLQGKLRPDHEGVEIGIAEKIAIKAISKSSGIAIAKIEHMYKKEGDFGQVAVFSPIRPMLAERVKSPEEAREKMGPQFAAEYKLDGERIQIHMKERIILYSRSLENITNYYPDIVEKIGKSIRAHEVILEAEAVAINEDTGEFLPFQELMHRRRKYKIAKAVQDYPITVNFFDVILVDGKSSLNMPYKERRHLLESIVK